ncbi:uncharacterized protein DSM5745_02069 [Aspergillus mulundensis]|uniref:Uncharacterized protein n=1 Tax=Aspergillus mulundensis TaxID=1810919 RepID=A0A3D8SVJ7_9EURO|nr:Uncharacterized protein DSM5745_02069 [Aspergillus mulundensis]RDW90294.1 Uncharacterized protein DSM5745_02069 [Aspergillus mulundensis]
MQRAIEQAGSGFTGWVSSCLFCLDSSGDDERARHRQAMEQRGAEREMQICHSQPHLVPPMKLVVYDDLPSPGPPPRASSFPSWVMDEGKNLASRASSRASMSFRRKSTVPVRISAPTDFRVVSGTSTTMLTRSLTTVPVHRSYRPLELSFQSPANKLPELPRFSDFDFGLDTDQPQAAAIARPPKAYSVMTDFSYQARPRTVVSHAHRPSSSFNLPRKPVGSGSRRSSLATIDLLMERQAPGPSPLSSPLIPHFSLRFSNASPSIATGLATSAFPSSSPPTPWPDSVVGVGRTPLSNHAPPQAIHSHDATASASITQRTTKPTTTQTFTQTQVKNKALPPVPSRESYEPRTASMDVGTYIEPEHRSFAPSMATLSTSSRPQSRASRVTQWVLQQTTATPPRTPTSTAAMNAPVFPSTSSSSRKPSLSLSDKLSMRIRSRTLSGSTLTPSTPTVPAPVPVPGGFKLNSTTTGISTPPVSHTTPAQTRSSTLDSRVDKDFETPYPYASANPFPRQTQSSLHPTIHEIQQRSDPNYDYHTHPYDLDVDRHRHSATAIGVAF